MHSNPSNNILITGHLGFIGSHLHSLFPEAVGWDLEDGHDICESLPDEDFTHIFHLAAYRSVPKGEMYPRGFIINNCWGTTHLAKTYPNARIINVSSSAANECKSIYGMTKYFTEMFSNSHKNWLNVRLYNVFGEGQALDSGAVVPQFIEHRIKKTRPVIYGDGTQVRDFTYVGDVVEELNRLMFATKDTGLSHIGYSNPISVIELCQRICGHDANIQFLPKRGFEIEYSCAPWPMINTYGRWEGLNRTIEFWEKHAASQA